MTLSTHFEKCVLVPSIDANGLPRKAGTGSDSQRDETRAEDEHFGILSLRGSHVRVTPAGAVISFVGKSGKQNSCTSRDSVLRIVGNITLVYGKRAVWMLKFRLIRTAECQEHPCILKRITM